MPRRLVLKSGIGSIAFNSPVAGPTACTLGPIFLIGPHGLRFGGIVKELYDVGVLQGVIRPMAVGFKMDEV